MVKVIKLTGPELMHKAIEATVLKDMESSLSLEKIYECKHSPIYTQLFWIEMEDIPSFVSTHFVRHHVGVQHYVSSRRDDRGGSIGDGRHSPVKHSMLLNAMALITMAHSRLCYQSHCDTTKVMMEIRNAIKVADPALAEHLVPKCLYLSRCPELKSCGFYGGLHGAPDYEDGPEFKGWEERSGRDKGKV